MFRETCLTDAILIMDIKSVKYFLLNVYILILLKIDFEFIK